MLQKRGSCRLLFVLVLLLSLCAFQASAFLVYGKVINSTGSDLDGANVTILQGFEAFGFTLSNVSNTITNSTGDFNITIGSDGSTDSYTIQIRKNDSAGNYTDLGPTIPQLVESEITSKFNGRTIRTTEPMNFLVETHNASQMPNFFYMAFDDTLGEPISMTTGSATASKHFAVRTDRNVSVYVVRSDSTDFIPNRIRFSNLSDYSGSPAFAFLNLSVNSTRIRVTGYVEPTGATNTSLLNHYTFKKYMTFIKSDDTHLVPLDFVFNTEEDDTYNQNTGFYNISLYQGLDFTVGFFSNDSTTFYGVYQNFSYASAPSTELNLSVTPLAGTYSFGQDNSTNTSITTFNYTSLTAGETVNSILSSIEVTYNSISYIFAQHDDQGGFSASETSFPFSLYNNTRFKLVMRSIDFEPLVRIFNPTQFATNATLNIGLNEFRRESFNGTSFAETDMNLRIYLSNATCDVPNEPPSGCLQTTITNMSAYDPFFSILDNRAFSARINHSSGVEMHYVNIDFLASGIPGGQFDQTQASGIGSGSSNIRRFGSSSPVSYDKVIMSYPYSEADLNENLTIFYNIPYLYDDDLVSVEWNLSVNTTAQIPSRFSVYNQSLFDSVGVQCSDIDTTQVCYVNKTSNVVWLTLPRFSGGGSQVSGTAPAASTATTTTSSGGGGSGSNVFRGQTKDVGILPAEGKQVIMSEHSTLKFTAADGEKHQVAVEDISEREGYATGTVSSVPEDFRLTVGESATFDLDGNGQDDFSLTLDDIRRGRAYFTLIEIAAVALAGPSAAEVAAAEEALAAEAARAAAQEEEQRGIVGWLVALLVLLLVCAGAYWYKRAYLH